MKKRLLMAAAGAVLVASSLFAPVLAGEIQRQISVTGEGRVATVPDMATITLGVTHQAKEARDALAATSDATALVLQRLAGMGVEARDIQTSNLSLNPVWSDRNYSDTGNAKITGFVASNTVLVRLRDLTNMGRVLDAIVADGANNFNGLRFSVQDPDPLMEQARQRAVADAIARATVLSSAAGVTLGKVLSMADQGGGRPMVLEMSAARGASVPIAAGEVTLAASVSMVFAIED